LNFIEEQFEPVVSDISIRMCQDGDAIFSRYCQGLSQTYYKIGKVSALWFDPVMAAGRQEGNCLNGEAITVLIEELIPLAQ